MKHPFRLSKSNKIYISIVVIGYTVFKLLSTRFSAHGFGQVFGFLISLIAIPLLFAFINWLVNGRRKNAGTITFNITLTIILLAQIGSFVNEMTKKQSIRDITNSKEELKEQLLRQGDSANVDSIYSSFSKNQSKSINTLIETSSGDERKAYQIMKAFKDKNDSISSPWSNALEEVNKPRILDIALLTNDEECEYQLAVVQNYLAKSLDYQSFFNRRITLFENSIEELTDKKNELAIGMVEGLKSKNDQQAPVFKPLIEAHVDYGSGMIQLIKLFQNQKGKWSFDENGYIKFKAEEAQTKYGNLIQEITISENTINELSDKLIEVL